MSSSLSSSETDNPSSDDSDDSGDELMILYHQHQLMYFQNQMRKKRKQKWIHDRIAWMRHVEKEKYSTDFETTYRLSFSTFEMLKGMLGKKSRLIPSKAETPPGQTLSFRKW
jgi:hypothetical protein